MQSCCTVPKLSILLLLLFKKKIKAMIIALAAHVKEIKADLEPLLAGTLSQKMLGSPQRYIMQSRPSSWSVEGYGLCKSLRREEQSTTGVLKNRSLGFNHEVNLSVTALNCRVLTPIFLAGLRLTLYLGQNPFLFSLSQLL